MNTEIINQTRDVFKINLSNEKIPNIVPTAEVNPRLVKVSKVYTSIKTTTGSGTSFTPNANQDCYIRSVTLSIIKDATCDTADGSNNWNCYVDGLQQYFYIPLLTLTAQNNSKTWTFTPALKIDRGTAIGWGNNTFAAGKNIRSIEIEYYIDEYSNA